MTSGKSLPFLAFAVATAAAGTLGWLVWRLDQRVGELVAATEATRTTLQGLDREVARLRIEQSADGKGPNALIERLAAFAPLLASSRTTQPDYHNARTEMEQIRKAFVATGADAWPALRKRWEQLDAQDFDQLKWVLDCAVAVDGKAGSELLKRVLLGQEKPNARLRWWAADLLVQYDRPLAQQLLRQVLNTESARGINPERAAAYGTSVLDPAAIATSGFHNFIDRYVQTGDSEIDATLLMLLGRSEHDLPTIQHCVKVLGERKYAPAQKRIEELYRKPPGISDNPIFARHCLDALVGIRGKDAIPFLEGELKNPLNELVARHVQTLLEELRTGKTAAATGNPATTGDPAAQKK